MPTGAMTTYDLNVGLYLDLEDRIHLLSPVDTPLINGVDGVGMSALASDTCFEKEVSWLDEEILLPSTTANGAHLVGDTAINLPAGEAIRGGVGDVFRIGAEFVRITAADYATDTWTVTRAYGGSTAAAIDDGAVIVGVGKALPEGSDPEVARSLDRTKRANITQIFGPEKVTSTGTQEAIRKYGIKTSEFDHQVANRIKEANIREEQAILYGGYFDDTANNIRTMGGLSHFVQTNVDSVTTTLTEDALADQVQACFDAGGFPDRLLVDFTQKRTVSSFDSSSVRFNAGTPAANGRGQVVDYVDTDAGRIWVFLDRWVRSSDAFLYSRDQLVRNTLRPLVFEMLAKTGDSKSGQVLSERTLKVYKERHAARFTALT